MLVYSFLSLYQQPDQFSCNSWSQKKKLQFIERFQIPNSQLICLFYLNNNNKKLLPASAKNIAYYLCCAMVAMNSLSTISLIDFKKQSSGSFYLPERSFSYYIRNCYEVELSGGEEKRVGVFNLRTTKALGKIFRTRCFHRKFQ